MYFWSYLRIMQYPALELLYKYASLFTQIFNFYFTISILYYSLPFNNNHFISLLYISFKPLYIISLAPLPINLIKKSIYHLIELI